MSILFESCKISLTKSQKYGSIQPFGKYIKSCVMPLDFVISGWNYVKFTRVFREGGALLPVFTLFSADYQ